jgi:hypothetical protein
MPIIIGREPCDLICSAQVHLLWWRRDVGYRNEREWDNLTAAYNVLEKCLKEVENDPKPSE